jgi:iron(III) transport system substrate-binding protein
VQRYLYILLFILILVLPFVLRMTLTRAQQTPEAVLGPSAGRLVVVTPHNQDIRREFARAFSDWHIRNYGQPVELDYRTPGGTGDIRRMLETTYRGFRQTDGALPETVPVDIHIVWGGGDFFFDVELKPLGILQPLEIDPQLLDEAFPEHSLAGVRLYDHVVDEQGRRQPPHWVGVCLSSFGIVYNPNLYKALQLPEPVGWADLTHERLHGMVALADPTHSGSAAVAYMMVIQRAMADAEERFLRRVGGSGAGVQEEANTDIARFREDPEYERALEEGWKEGMRQLLLIAANARYFTDSASQVPRDVSIGDAAAGMAIDFYGRVYEEIVGPERVRFISPYAATAITPDPVAILHGVSGEHRELANRFVRFLLTPAGQRLWILPAGEPYGPRQRSLHRPPIRQDLYEDRTGWTDDVNPFEEAGDFNQRQEWMALFGDTRPIWSAAWIDSRDALKSAYARVLRVQDPARRAQLIFQLSDLPIKMVEVQEQQKERRQIQRDGGPIDEWRARKRIEWANRFRRHYAEVAARANE